MAKWTADELLTLRALYPCMPNAELAKRLGRAPRVIGMRARALGLAKCEAFRASELSGCFRPGEEPANKGRRRPGYAPGRMAQTQFKKGRPKSEARNYKPIGSLRISKDGYLERKVTDEHPVPARRWVAVHRLVWEAAYGTVPAGHAVGFLLGRQTAVEAEITIDRLELVSRRELMRRNSRHTRYPEELNQLIQLRGALRRKINKRTRDEESNAGRA